MDHATPEALEKSPPEILILEDDDAHVELIQEGFDRIPHRFRVSFAATLREARALIARHPPDLIISDWKLPDGKGIDILQREKGHVTIPVIIMTSYGSETLAVELMKSGAIDYLVKTEHSFRELPHTAERVLREWENIRKREEADRALLAQREYYETILENVHSGVWITGPDDIIEYANQGISHIAGIPREEIVGRRVPEDFAEGTIQELLPFYRRAQETQKAVNYYSIRVITPAGRECFQSGELVPRTEGGIYQGMICTVTDVTEKKRAEDAVIRLNEGLLELGADTGENIRKILALGGSLLGASILLFNRIQGDRCSVAYSWGAPENLRKDVLLSESLCYEVYRQNQPFLVIENLREGPYRERYSLIDALGFRTYAGHVIRDHDERVGTLCVLYTTPATLNEADRNLVGLLATAIGREEERRVAQETLRQSEERFRSQYENSPVAIFTWQKKGDDFELIDCNNAAIRFSEGRASALMGVRAKDLYAHRPEHLQEMSECYEKKSIISKDLISQNFLPGRYIHTTAAYIPPDIVLLHDEDITDRKFHQDVQSLSNQVFQISYRHTQLRPMMDEFVRLIQQYTGTECVGLRLLNPDLSIPYTSYTGFPQEFYELESPLNIGRDECMCIYVVKGTTDPTQPFFTPGGSFL